jgi:glycosyltransferase involved in cell wall biosynthesis
MKIAHIASPDFTLTREYGGTESVVCNLAEKQVLEGHDVTIVASSAARDTCMRPVSLVKPARKYNHWFLYWISQRLNGAIHVCKSFNWLDSKFEIIHNHLSEEGIAFSFLRKSPCLNTLHGTAHERLPQYCISRAYSITRNTKLVALSRSAYLQHKRFYGDDLIGYVHNGVNTQMFKFVSKAEKESEVEICFTGRISPDKSIKEIILIADILHNRGIDVHLKIVGKFDPRNVGYFQEITRLVNERNYVSKYTNVTREEVKCLVGNSDVFVFPISKTEPFALAPLESMVCGTPVVSLKRAAAVDYIVNGVNGFLCNDLSEMADAVLRYGEINRQTCREIVEKNFSVDSMYRRYMKIYEKVIAAG